MRKKLGSPIVSLALTCALISEDNIIAPSVNVQLTWLYLFKKMILIFLTYNDFVL